MKEVLKQHVSLHRTRFERASLTFGLNPWVSYTLIPIIFVGLSFLWFSHGKLTEWTYVIPAVFILFIISQPDRLRFYKQIYSDNIFFKIRWLENFLIAIPFLIFMIFKTAYLPFLVLLSITILLGIKDRSDWTSFALPTPFYRFPFEFTSGFRYSWILILGLYALALISCSVDNEALGIFTLIALTLSSTIYYQNPETEYFVWIHNMNSKSFLKHKIIIALSYTMLIVFPMLTLVIFVWPSFTMWTIIGVLSSLMFIATTIVAKYTMYPHIFNLPLLLVLSLGFVAPPILLIIFPILYSKAAKNLKHILP